MTITLPEITIEGTPEPALCVDTDWWCQGFVFGANHPDVEPGPPAPLSDEYLQAYYAGAAAGRQAMAHYEASQQESEDAPSDVPTIGPDRGGGQSYDKLEAEYREAWAEFLGHRHEPHTEIETYEAEAPPPPPIVFAAP